MRLKNFEYIANQIIMERGRNIFEQNKITYKDNYACVYYFTVEGSNMYNVEILLRDDLTVKYTSCDCFYDKMRICKRIIACLFYLRKKKNVKTLV